MRLATLSASRDQLLAASRVLRQLLHSSSPIVTRAVAEALGDSNPRDAFRFVEHCEAALLEPPIVETPVRLTDALLPLTHLVDMRNAYDADARD